MKKASTLFSLLFLVGFFARAQGWESTFGSPAGNDVFYQVIGSPTGDDGLIFVGQTTAPDGSSDAFFVRTNALGRPLAQNRIGETGANEVANVIFPTSDGRFLMAINQNKNNLDSLVFQQIDAKGQSISTKMAAVSGARIWGGAATLDGHFVFCGDQNDGSQVHLFLIKVDFDGNEIWQKSIPIGDDCQARAATATADGGCLVAGYAKIVGANGSDAILLKINELGDLEWQKTFGGPLEETIFGMAATASGGAVLAGFQKDASEDSDPLLLFYDPAQPNLTSKIFDNSTSDELRSAAFLPDGNLAFCGSSQITTTAKRDFFLMKTNAAGELIFETKKGGAGSEQGWSIFAKTDGSLAFAGNRAETNGSAFLEAAATQTDALGNSFGGRIRGKILMADDFCQPTAMTLEGWKIEAQTGTNRFFSESKKDGSFEIEAPIGLFVLKILMPVEGVWQPCLASQVASILQPTDTVELDFLVKKIADCAVLQVDVATDHLQKCDTSKYVLTVKNWGSVLAPNAQIEVRFDSFLEAVGSGAGPLILPLGDMQSLDNQRVTFDLVLACGPNFDRQTHTVEARESDILHCPPPPFWDESDIQAAAFCDAANVKFNLENKGNGGLGQDSEYIIIEDVFPLVVPNGGSIQAPLAVPIEVDFPADGSTFMIRAKNTPGHPSGTRPYAFVEGCNLGGGTFEHGFPLQFAHDDGLPQVEIDCREGFVGLDPDFLKAFPTGFGADHRIEKTDAIDYLLRFENQTGTTATRLEIRDTLSPFLDPSRIEIGSSSHPFSLEWRGERTMVFTFDSINLGQNERGFVKFRIKIDSAAALGSVILNRSAAYFDFAAPVFSNSVFHTLDEEKNYLTVSSVEPKMAQNMPIRLAPNPFFESCRAEWSGGENENFTVRLTDLAGHVLIEKTVVGPRVLIEKDGLPIGLFLMQVIQNERVMGREKIILR